MTKMLAKSGLRCQTCYCKLCRCRWHKKVARVALPLTRPKHYTLQEDRSRPVRALGISSRTGQADKDVAGSARAGASGWIGSRAQWPIRRSQMGAQVAPHCVADSAHAEHSDTALSERPFRGSYGIQSRSKGHNITAPHNHLYNARVDHGSKHSPTWSELRKMDMPTALQERGARVICHCIAMSHAKPTRHCLAG